MSLEAAPEITDYAQVPVYRRRWCYLLLMLFLTPVGILVALTGEVYAMNDGAVEKLPAASRVLSAIGFTALIIANFARASG